jgi:glycosyltransferase involved in cell wall biosynthesis
MMARNCIGLGRLPRILFQHNVESQILARHASDGPHWLRRRYMALQCRKMRRFEAWAGRQFDWIVAVSGHDRDFFEQQYGWRHVRAIDTAVDVDYFQPSSATVDRDRVVFLGSMDWLPNQDGVAYFVRHVWPRVMAARPRARFQIVGRNPTPAVLRLAQQPGVEVAGTVPDVRPYLAGASVVVVPLLVGGGTRIKIFEALSMEKAVVSTSLGAEGLPVEPGRHLLLADGPAGFARSVLTLLDDPHQAARLGHAGRELVLQSYGAEKIARQFERICAEAAGLVHDVGPSVAAVAGDQAAPLEQSQEGSLL